MIELTQKQLDYIQSVLEKHCKGEVCIKRTELFDKVCAKLNLTMEPYKFETAVTKAIKNNLLTGFQTRPGRNGGICRAGVFAEKDLHRKKYCDIIVGGQKQLLLKNEHNLIYFLVNVLKAKQVKSNGSIIINDKHFKVKDISPEEVFLSFITLIK